MQSFESFEILNLLKKFSGDVPCWEISIQEDQTKVKSPTFNGFLQILSACYFLAITRACVVLNINCTLDFLCQENYTN